METLLVALSLAASVFSNTMLVAMTTIKPARTETSLIISSAPDLTPASPGVPGSTSSPPGVPGSTSPTVSSTMATTTDRNTATFHVTMTTASPNITEHHIRPDRNSSVTMTTNNTHITTVSPGNNTQYTVTTPSVTTATGNGTTIAGSSPISVSPDNQITFSSSPPTLTSTLAPPPPAADAGVPGWGIALLVLAALVLLLLLLLLAALLVWWCCCRGRYSHFSPNDHLTHKNNIPLYTTHSHFEAANGRPYEEVEPTKKPSGTYTVNQQ